MKQTGKKNSMTIKRITGRAAAFAMVLLLLCSPACPAFAADGYDKVASGSETAKSLSVGKYGMIPVYGFDVEDGTYDISVDSSSSFFHIHEAKLMVKDGKMTAEMTLSSTSYKFI